MRLPFRLLAWAAATLLLAACGSSEVPTPPSPAPSAGAGSARALVPSLAADRAANEPAPPPPSPVTIAAVGDVMLGRGVAHAITAGDPAGHFAGVRDVLLAADIAVANLECVISDFGAPEPKAYTFRAPPLAARGLALAGFDAVNLANNHTLDYGLEALLDTIARLESEGIAVAGAGPDLAAALRPAILERNGLRIAVVGFADVPSEAGYNMRGWEAAPGKPGLAWAGPETVAAGVRSAREHADMVIVMFHFGAEYASAPDETQRLLARAAIDAGAILVLGSHPHVLQEIEEYAGGLIAYSLGNFVFDGFEGAANTTAILRVTIGPEGIASWELLPATIGWDGLPTLD